MVFVLAALASSPALFASTVVVPNANSSAVGNAVGAFPAGTSSVELQELIGNGQMPSGTIQITGLSFRAAPGNGPVNVTFGNLAIYLSTSPNYPNTSGSGKTLMSSTFAANAGMDKTLVFSANNVVWQDAGCSTGPCPFDLTVTFTTPFSYTAGSGPLLVDLQVTNLTATSGALDAETFAAPGGGVAQVVGTLGGASGTFAYEGDILQLTYTSGSATGTAPTISGVVNPAGNMQPGFPNYGLAQGSIFTIYGSNLGPTPAAQASSLPLPASAGLGGTTVTLSLNGVTVNAPILYSGATQINAIIPSTAPVGSNSLTVTYNGNSLTTKVPIVASNFGIVQYGSSQAVVTFASGAVVGLAYTASPGDELVLWGTGLGPLPAGQSDASGAVGGNLPAQIQVFVGGVSASILYQGRTPGSTGLDQINFVVPASAPQGCSVPVIVQTTSGTTLTASNAPTIAISPNDGATCVDPTQNVPQSLISGVNGQNGAKVLAVQMKQNTSYSAGSGSLVPSVTASAGAFFLNYSPAQLSAQAGSFNSGNPSLTSCVTTTYPAVGSFSPQASGLNAGTSVTLTPPSGSKIILSPAATGEYQAQLSGISSGTYKLSNAGGADVSSLSLSFPVPQITWTNMTQLAGTPVTRSSGLTIDWTGGDSTGYVEISGEGQTPTGQYTFKFSCTAPAATGTFTVPPAILSNMPTGTTAQAFIEVDSDAFPASLGTVTGFNDTINLSTFQTVIPVIFQ